MRNEDALDELEARLARTLRADDGPALSSRWRAGVMDAVRAEAARADEASPVEPFVRRALFIAAAAAIAATLVVVARAGELDPAREVARLLVSDPQGLLQALLVL
jgi:hypothetical protein